MSGVPSWLHLRGLDGPPHLPRLRVAKANCMKTMTLYRVRYRNALTGKLVAQLGVAPSVGRAYAAIAGYEGYSSLRAMYRQKVSPELPKLFKLRTLGEALGLHRRVTLLEDGLTVDRIAELATEKNLDIADWRPS